MSETIFDLIVAKKVPSWVVWEHDKYLAFLTPFPNTPGLTVVIPKSNPGDYVFNLDNDSISGLVNASKTVAKALQKAFNVKRVAMVIEGTGVPYVHVKLYPLHGHLGGQSGVEAHSAEFYPVYRGYLSTAEGPKMEDSELTKLQQQIVEAAKS